MLDRKLWRDLMDSKGLLLAIGSIIWIGVVCFVALNSAYQNLTAAQTLYYAQCRMADFSLELKKAPLSELALIDEIPGIKETRHRVQFNVTVDIERVAEPLNGLVLSLPENRSPVINDIVLTRGSYFTTVRDEEVIINDAFAAAHNLHPGDRLHLILNNRRQELFIVGTAISSEFVYLLGRGSIVPDPEHFGVFYLKRRYMEEVFGFQGAANQIVGLLTPEAAHRVDEILQIAENKLAPYGVFATIPRAEQSSHMFLHNEIQGLRTFAVAMPVIFLAVAALVLNVLLSRLIENQRTTIGTLKALGYTDFQLLVHYLKFGLMVGSLGGLFGCWGGYGLAGLMTGVYQTFFEFPDLQNRPYPIIYLQALSISLLCAAFGAAHGVLVVMRLEPAEAMRPKPPRLGGAILLEHWTWFWSQLNTAWRMTFRNVWRNRLRTAVGIFASAMGAALLSYSFITKHAIDYLIDFQFEKVWTSDVDLYFESERGREALDEVRQLPGVDHAEPMLAVGCEFSNGPHRKKSGITGLLPNARLTIPRNSQGLPVPVPASGLLMNQSLADILHVRPGDWITMRPTQGLREPCRVQVMAVSDSYLGLACYADMTYLNHLIHEEFVMTGAQLQIDFRKRDELYRELKQLPALQSVDTRTQIIENLVSTFIDTNMVFIVMMILFSGVIFFGSTLNGALISLAERQREVGTLLVLGYPPFTVGGLFLREALLVNGIGTILGMPLGYLLILMMASVYNSEMFRIPVITPPILWVYTALTGLIFILLSHFFLQRSINKTNWADALKVKE